MIQLKYDHTEVIRDLLAERIEGSKIGDRCPIDHAMKIISINAVLGKATVFVDNPEKPSALLILTHAHSAVCKETTVIMNMIYISEKVREENGRLAIALTNEMFQTAEAFAKAKRADVLQAASWIYRESPDISNLLKHHGFEPQTIEFVKILNHPKQ